MDLSDYIILYFDGNVKVRAGEGDSPHIRWISTDCRPQKNSPPRTVFPPYSSLAAPRFPHIPLRLSGEMPPAPFNSALRSGYYPFFFRLLSAHSFAFSKPLRSLSLTLNAKCVPRATHPNGSSATWHFTPNSLVIYISNPLSSAPPPVRSIPWS